MLHRISNKKRVDRCVIGKPFAYLSRELNSTLILIIEYQLSHII